MEAHYQDLDVVVTKKKTKIWMTLLSMMMRRKSLVMVMDVVAATMTWTTNPIWRLDSPTWKKRSSVLNVRLA
jgi:hypothetical protein